MKRNPSILLLLVMLLSLAPAAVAQSISTSLANLPDADLLIYVSPQRLFSDFVPKVMPAKEVADMQAGFAEMKKAVGVDPTTVEYVVLAVRFHKPTGDLNFVAPDVMAVVGGDFSSESLLTLAQLTLQDKVQTQKHGSKTLAIMKVDQIAKEAEKTPLLKPFVEMAAVALSPNSLAVGNLRFINSAVEAAESGTGRIKPETLQSLMRDPNVFMAASGAPLLSFARSFGLLGTETTPREGRFNSEFGNFYVAAVVSGANYSMRGAMNADNPDTAKIITNLLSSLIKTNVPIPDKRAQAILQTLKLTAKDNEVTIEADIPFQMIVDFIREQSKPKAQAIPVSPPKKPAARRPVQRTKRRN